MPFLCSICEEESNKICVNCTKDACGNHLCDRCARCSDCCGCGIVLVEEPRHVSAGTLRSPRALDLPTGELEISGHRAEGILDDILLVDGDGPGEA